MLKKLIKNALLYLYRSSDGRLALIFRKIFKFERFKLDPEFIYQWDVSNTSLKMIVSLDSYIENKLFFNKNYGKNVIETILNYRYSQSNSSKEKPVLIDVGANIGSICLPIAISKKDWKIIAYEPNPTVYRRLLKNVELNNLSNIQTVMKGVSSESCDLFLNTSSSAKANFGNSSYLENSDIVNPKKIKTKVTTLDEDISPQTNVSVIKIDTQGFELKVLQGAKGTIRKWRPFIIFEIEDIYQNSPSDYRVSVKKFFKELQYELYYLDQYNHKILRNYDSSRIAVNANVVAIPKFISSNDH